MIKRVLISFMLLHGLANGQAYAEVRLEESKPEKATVVSGELNTKDDDLIWLEEQISPATRWLDNLVKPLTSWMEQQLQEPESESTITTKPYEFRDVSDETKKTNKKQSENFIGPLYVISSDQAKKIALKHIDGDVLFIKLIPKSNQYRVKLISKLGEIHVFYILADTGEIALENNQTKPISKEPTEPSPKEQP